MSLYQAIALGVVLAAVVWDLATRRIPNVLTFGAAALALLVHGYFGSWSGVGFSLAGWLVGVAFFLPFFALGGMGAGDVKLLGAVGAWLGPVAVIWVALFTSIAGGVMGLVVAAFSGYLTKAFTNLWCLVMYWRIEGPRPVPELTLSSHKGPRLAYAVPVLAGLVLTLWLR
jgi:prepilin peptidase CpaA